jgi:hypothetical protein
LTHSVSPHIIINAGVDFNEIILRTHHNETAMHPMNMVPNNRVRGIQLCGTVFVQKHKHADSFANPYRDGRRNVVRFILTLTHAADQVCTTIRRGHHTPSTIINRLFFSTHKDCLLRIPTSGNWDTGTTSYG